ncbi:glycosyltransferase family 4 protein [Echinicola marina]|nr:glycosyltransferase family 4 protein [Echinicola marina]
MICKYLIHRGFQIKITCTYAGGPIADSFQKLGVELIQVGAMKGPFDIDVHRKVQNLIKSFRPHIIHGGVFEGNSVTAISGFLKNVPIRIIEETSDPQNRSTKANWLLKIYSKMSDKVVAISPKVYEYLSLEAKIKPKEKIVLINNAVQAIQRSASNEIARLKLKFGIGDGNLVIGFVGRLNNDHKRISDLLSALPLLKSNRIKLLIVGNGVDMQMIKERVDELKLSNQVIFAGYQFNTSIFYQIMDIACFPSAREGFGLVAAEAMMHHLPVVATKVGGLQNVVVDGETGFLVPPYNPQSLADKLQHLIDHPDLRTQFGHAGYERAKKHYSAERYVKEVEDLYLGLLKEKGITP